METPRQKRVNDSLRNWNARARTERRSWDKRSPSPLQDVYYRDLHPKGLIMCVPNNDRRRIGSLSVPY